MDKGIHFSSFTELPHRIFGGCICMTLRNRDWRVERRRTHGGVQPRDRMREENSDNRFMGGEMDDFLPTPLWTGTVYADLSERRWKGDSSRERGGMSGREFGSEERDGLFGGPSEGRRPMPKGIDGARPAAGSAEDDEGHDRHTQRGQKPGSTREPMRRPEDQDEDLEGGRRGTSMPNRREDAGPGRGSAREGEDTEEHGRPSLNPHQQEGRQPSSTRGSMPGPDQQGEGGPRGTFMPNGRDGPRPTGARLRRGADTTEDGDAEEHRGPSMNPRGESGRKPGSTLRPVHNPGDQDEHLEDAINFGTGLFERMRGEDRPTTRETGGMSGRGSGDEERDGLFGGLSRRRGTPGPNGRDGARPGQGSTREADDATGHDRHRMNPQGGRSTGSAGGPMPGPQDQYEDQEHARDGRNGERMMGTENTDLVSGVRQRLSQETRRIQRTMTRLTIERFVQLIVRRSAARILKITTFARILGEIDRYYDSKCFGPMNLNWWLHRRNNASHGDNETGRIENRRNRRMHGSMPGHSLPEENEQNQSIFDNMDNEREMDGRRGEFRGLRMSRKDDNLYNESLEAGNSSYGTNSTLRKQKLRFSPIEKNFIEDALIGVFLAPRRLGKQRLSLGRYVEAFVSSRGHGNISRNVSFQSYGDRVLWQWEDSDDTARDGGRPGSESHHKEGGDFSNSRRGVGRSERPKTCSKNKNKSRARILTKFLNIQESDGERNRSEMVDRPNAMANKTREYHFLRLEWLFLEMMSSMFGNTTRCASRVSDMLAGASSPVRQLEDMDEVSDNRNRGGERQSDLDDDRHSAPRSRSPRSPRGAGDTKEFSGRMRENITETNPDRDEQPGHKGDRQTDERTPGARNPKHQGQSGLFSRDRGRNVSKENFTAGRPMFEREDDGCHSLEYNAEGVIDRAKPFSRLYLRTLIEISDLIDTLGQRRSRGPGRAFFNTTCIATDTAEISTCQICPNKHAKTPLIDDINTIIKDNWEILKGTMRRLSGRPMAAENMTGESSVSVEEEGSDPVSDQEARRRRRKQNRREKANSTEDGEESRTPPGNGGRGNRNGTDLAERDDAGTTAEGGRGATIWCREGRRRPNGEEGWSVRSQEGRPVKETVEATHNLVRYSHRFIHCNTI